MSRYKRNIRCSLAVAILFGGLMSPLQAAVVPAGVTLAKVQKIVRNNGSDPKSLDPQTMTGNVGSKIALNLFEGLVTPGPEGQVLPGVAQKWQTEDNQTFVFHLRKDAKWSDGHPVTAQDFVYAWRRLIDPKTQAFYAYYLVQAGVKNAKTIAEGLKSPKHLGVTALDNYTLKVILNKASPYFVSMLTYPATYPTPAAVIQKWGDKWTHPEHIVSNGAYQLKTWKVDQYIDLVRNPHYWNNRQTIIDKVRVLPISDQKAALDLYFKGKIDVTDEIPHGEYASLKKRYPTELKTVEQLATYFYEFNNKHKPFNDPKVRKALSYAIEREVITGKALGQGQIPVYAFTPNMIDGFTPPILPWAKWSQQKRNKQGRMLLKQAGFDKDHPLKMKLLYNTSDNHRRVAEAIVDMWKENFDDAIEIQLEHYEWKEFLERRKAGKYQVSRAGWLADYNEASAMLNMLVCDFGTNFGHFCDPSYDSAIRQAARAVDLKRRQRHYNRAEMIIAEKMPVAPIYQYVSARMVKPHVGGYPRNPMGYILDKDLYIKAH